MPAAVFVVICTDQCLPTFLLENSTFHLVAWDTLTAALAVYHEGEMWYCFPHTVCCVVQS